MQELINVIPFLDVAIILILLFFLYIGWNQGVPRVLMVLGSIYTGFLLAAVYYHLFAQVLSGALSLDNRFVADLLSFIILDILVTVVMLALLMTLYGHIEIKGRAAIFDKLGGATLGMLTAVLVMGILIAFLRVPYEANKQRINPAAEMPVFQVFNNGYEKSALAPSFLSTMPFLMSSVTPMLPQQVREKGAVPLLESIITRPVAATNP